MPASSGSPTSIKVPWPPSRSWTATATAATQASAPPTRGRSDGVTPTRTQPPPVSHEAADRGASDDGHGEHGDPQGVDADPLTGHEQRPADPTAAVPPPQSAGPQGGTDTPQPIPPGRQGGHKYQQHDHASSRRGQ